MSIHRVRLIYSESGAASFNGWLSQWLLNMQPWAERENTTPTLVDGGLVDTPHYRGDLTFDWSEDKSIIEDQLNGYLNSYCDWSILGYHECEHDEENASPCSWDSVTEYGSIPDGVSL